MNKECEIERRSSCLGTRSIGKTGDTIGVEKEGASREDWDSLNSVSEGDKLFVGLISINRYEGVCFILFQSSIFIHFALV